MKHVFFNINVSVCISHVMYVSYDVMFIYIISTYYYYLS